MPSGAHGNLRADIVKANHCDAGLPFISEVVRNFV